LTFILRIDEDDALPFIDNTRKKVSVSSIQKKSLKNFPPQSKSGKIFFGVREIPQKLFPEKSGYARTPKQNSS
jgi:hypothetical protein